MTTTLTIGQQVRFVGQAVNIDHGAIGTIQRMHEVLTDCPVVFFPRGTFGPHSTFVITQPAADLEPAPPCLCAGTTTGTWYGQGHDDSCFYAR